jgi:tetratricopeptide (TPR) repeat protein
MAAAYQQLRDYDAAIAASNRALAIDSTNDGAYYNLGFALSSKGRVDEAIAAFSDATRVNAGFTRAYSAWGDLLNEQGRPGEALEILDRALAAPTEAEYRFLIYKNIGKAYIALGQYGDAIDNLEPALSLRPEWPETNWLLARSYEEAGRIEEAKDRYAKYIALENDPSLRKRGRDRLESL